MLANRTEPARHTASDGSLVRSSRHPAPRAAWICRLGSPRSIGFALLLPMLVGIPPAVGAQVLFPSLSAVSAGFAARFDRELDHDGNGLEDVLDAWLDGRASFVELRERSVSASHRAAAKAVTGEPGDPLPAHFTPAEGSWRQGRVRIIGLGVTAGGVTAAVRSAALSGHCRIIHALDHFGGVRVLDLDEPGLRAFLADHPAGRFMLDREGIPALLESRPLMGADRAAFGAWQLGDDWSTTVAILDSGCDTAHGDLGDAPDDNIDGPPPGVGDSGDWADAEGGWPLFQGYKVVGWHDVTDDFPLAAGPWDYHHHGTALASVVAGSGTVDEAYRGVAPGARLTVVKFYDFDETWHTWAGDFLAACAWTLDHRETYRIHTVLTAVNWEVDAGISAAMDAFVAAGMLPVAAVGNHGIDPVGPGYPAALQDVLTAGSVDDSGALSAFSGRGLTAPGKPDLLAPGGGLLPSGGRITAADNEPNDTYSGRFGTSLAAAHVAGAVHLLDEGLLENGVILPTDRSSVLTRTSLLKMTAAPVVLAENPDGTGHEALSYPVGPDAARGWGLLRIDAAVDAVLRPLRSGLDQADTLTMDWSKPVVARRLVTSPGVRYLIEVVPSGNLDVVLEVADPRWLDDPATHDLVRRQDASGPGVSEFTYLRPDFDSWLVMAVKRKSGQGILVLKLREADSFEVQGSSAVLPGLGTGAPNSGYLAGYPGPSLVIPSRITVDLAARSLNVFDSAGEFRPGWPVFVFPNSSSQGGLTQPLVWDLDGIPGDEIVVASDFGSVYFFTAGGVHEDVNLTINRSLTAPVGFETGGGERLVAVVDKLGNVRAWSHGPVLEAETGLNHNLPLAPAAGQLLPGTGESLVVAFADGFVAALDPDLNPLPGWPVDLGVALEVAPVLCDLDEDGLHEIYLATRDGSTGQVSLRVLSGQGTPLAGNGMGIPAPEGGGWLALSPAVVAGGYQTDDLRVTLTGLAENGLFGDQAAWVLGQGSLYSGGSVAATTLPGFRVKASTSQGLLTLDHFLLPAPVAWDFRGGGGADVQSLVSLNWTEILIGLTSMPGSCTGWFREDPATRPLTKRQGLTLGGSVSEPVGSAGTLLVPLAEDAQLRVDVLGELVGIMPVQKPRGSATGWLAARSDGRNSGAYPLRPSLSPVPDAVTAAARLQVYPNPGGGQFHFRISGVSLSAGLRLEIFDLRGRRVRTLAAGQASGLIRWDGADGQGRPLAAGTYLAALRGAGETLTTRVVLTH